MFVCQQMSRPNESGVRQVQVVDSVWDYHDAKLNWTRAFSFLPNWGRLWVRVVDGDVIISYGV